MSSDDSLDVIKQEKQEHKKIHNTSCQSLSRGLKLMDILAMYPNGCPLAKVAEEASLNKSTVHRLLQELMACGYVKTCQNPGNYRLSNKLLELGQHVLSSTNIYNIITPHLEKLNLSFSETVNFSMRDDDHAILLYKLNPVKSAIKTKTVIGQTLPLYCTAMGKIYLAFSSDEYIQNYWQNNTQNIVSITETTIVSFAQFMKEIEEIRKTYIAFDNEENELGVSCIAAPIFDLSHNNIYSISMSATTKKLHFLGIDYLKKILLDTAREISEDLGCSKYYV